MGMAMVCGHVATRPCVYGGALHGHNQLNGATARQRSVVAEQCFTGCVATEVVSECVKIPGWSQASLRCTPRR